MNAETGVPVTDAGEIIGRWKSTLRETRYGPMSFEFCMNGDGTMEVIGTPAAGSNVEEYRRSGAFRIDAGQLVSPAINEGRPVQIQLKDRILVLTIDEWLAFHLRRR